MSRVNGDRGKENVHRRDGTKKCWFFCKYSYFPIGFQTIFDEYDVFLRIEHFHKNSCVFELCFWIDVSRSIIFVSYPRHCAMFKGTQFTLSTHFKHWTSIKLIILRVTFWKPMLTCPVSLAVWFRMVKYFPRMPVPRGRLAANRALWWRGHLALRLRVPSGGGIRFHSASSSEMQKLSETVGSCASDCYLTTQRLDVLHKPVRGIVYPCAGTAWCFIGSIARRRAQLLRLWHHQSTVARWSRPGQSLGHIFRPVCRCDGGRARAVRLRRHHRPPGGPRVQNRTDGMW